MQSEEQFNLYENLTIDAFFTNLALWDGSVIESPYPSVCVYVTKNVIVNYGKIVMVFSSSFNKNRPFYTSTFL